MEALNNNVVLGIYVLASTAAVILKVRKWLKTEKAASKWLQSFQIRYFLCYFAYMNGLSFQGPYVYQRYLDSGLEAGQISIIMSTFNVVSALYGFVVGHATEMLGHKTMIIVSALCLSMHATLRYVGGFPLFLLASAIMGVSTAANKVVFEDWLIAQLQSPDAPKLAQATVQENSALIRLIVTLVMTPLSAKLTQMFGSSAAFNMSSLMFLMSAAIIAVAMDAPPRKENKKRLSYGGAMVSIFNAVRKSRELAALLIIDFSYSVFFLLYSPRWLSIHQITRKDRLPLSQMSSTSSVALMNGAQLFGAFLQFVTAKTSLAAGFLAYLVAVVGILVFFADKNIVYMCYMLASVCDGGINTSIRIAKGSIYPSDVRGYILGLLKVPTSLCVSGILFLLRGAEAWMIVAVSSMFLALTTVMSFYLSISARSESKSS